MLRGALPAPRPDGDHGFAEEIRARRALAAAGLQEVITYSAVDSELAANTSADGIAPVAAIPIANPMSAEASVLRTSLLGSLLRMLRNSLRQRERVLLFELARTWQGQLDPLPNERRHVGLVMVGPREPRSWSDVAEPLEFFDLKGMVDAVCEALSVEVTYAPSRDPRMHPGRTAEVCANGRKLGVIGQLHPAVAERFDLEPQHGSVLVGELDFELLLEARAPLQTITTPSRFPPSDRDIAIVVDEDAPHADVAAVIRDAGRPLLERVELFDVYRGEPIPPGRKSLAFSLRYRASDRTLEDDEVSTVHGRIERELRDTFRGDVRGR
jgi:phenylalanyl-tRNA synthetase beta chain